MTLVQSALPPVSSCLIKNQGEQLSSSMKRAILEVWIISVIFIISFSRRDLYKDTVNLLLFTCEKFLRGSGEPICRDYFSPRISICHIIIFKKKSVDKAW